jgi:two-component system, response regulator
MEEWYMAKHPDKKMVLVVEDNPDDELMTVETLQHAGMTNDIEVMRDGAEAVDFLFGTGAHAGRDLSLMPAVILLDLKLPKLSGIDVLNRIRANELTAHIPVVILTSSSEDEDMISSYKSGANSYVRKPVQFSQFADAVHQVGMYWLLINEPPPE